MRIRMKKQDGRIIMDKIKFVTDEGETVEFYVEEQTRVNGTDYLLVTCLLYTSPSPRDA